MWVCVWVLVFSTCFGGWDCLLVEFVCSCCFGFVVGGWLFVSCWVGSFRLFGFVYFGVLIGLGSVVGVVGFDD